MKWNRGYESPLHYACKIDVDDVMKAKKGIYNIGAELKNTDIVYARKVCGRLELIAVEVEMTHRNAIRNAERNFKNGIDKQLTIAKDEKTKTRILYRYSKYLPIDIQKRILTITIDRMMQRRNLGARKYYGRHRNIRKGILQSS